ncbi:hypothetical protein [Methylomonas fluvii]|uniref:Lipoprotein n=1 Tax=Methylomonas fluvii TaxID=1854564 RepID=A0ABR9D7A3_9GAMM|nr:hypothetical protein [Methylomonas fluvii]MBD9359000.1 hypothetical protein [Methylomonas fluvii]CAD6871668.1 hypothetical protein [Methylomonas fluvii]
MSIRNTPVTFLVPILFCIGCSTLPAPSDLVSETVIESLVTPSLAELPWRLDHARQPSRLGGSVWCTSSIEHVVRREDPVWPTITDSSLDEFVRNESAEAPDPMTLERAWRKYCHHQLDLTDVEREMLQRNPPPVTSPSTHCDPRSLKK